MKKRRKNPEKNDEERGSITEQLYSHLNLANLWLFFYRLALLTRKKCRPNDLFNLLNGQNLYLKEKNTFQN